MIDIENVLYDEVPASELDKALRESDALNYATDDEGNLASNEIIRRVYEALGYDSVLIDAKKTFSGMDIEEGVKHLMVFEPEKLRSEFATFDPSKRKSRNLMATTVPLAMGINAMRGER